MNNTGQQKNTFSQFILKVSLFPGSHWPPEHDGAIRFSFDQTVFP